ncbi:MAG: RraA family protein [Pseudohongiellaceae bacterium]
MTANSTPKSAQMNAGPGFRIRLDIERPPQELVEQFRQFDTPDISDMLNRMYAMNNGIYDISDAGSICGPACTVKVFPGDNLMVHKVLDVAKPGDVVVVDAGGSKSNAVLGDLICTKAKHRGIAAFVIDGLVRDLPDITADGFPVFACGETPIGPLHRGPGEINFPVSCGGVVVNPGDIIVGDKAGIVVIRKEFAQETLQRLNEQKLTLDPYVASVKKGDFSNEWVDRYLNDANCTITTG